LILALISLGLFPLFALLGLPLLPRISLFSDIPLKMDSLNNILLKGVTIGAKSGASHPGLPFLLYAYIFIAGVQVVRMFWSFLSVFRLWLKSDRTKKEGLNIAITPGYVPVFSIFNWIFIDRQALSLKDSSLILAHEKLHIQQRHTFDLLLGEVLRIPLWFNPFMHLILKEIKANHEFLADLSVAEAPERLNNYQNLLVQLSTSIDFNILTHNFSYSLIKRRINMIKKPNRSMRKFQLYSLTLLAMAGVLFACSTNPSKVENNQSANSTAAKPENQVKQVSVYAMMPDSARVYDVVEKMPMFPGGTDALMKYLATHIIYPAQAKKDGIQGKVYAQFIINTDGSISGIRILKGVSPSLDAEVIRILKSMPKWTPGEEKGKKVRVKYALPVKFTLE
jgi:TonB family protein